MPRGAGGTSHSGLESGAWQLLCTPPLTTYIIVAVGFVRNEWGVKIDYRCTSRELLKKVQRFLADALRIAQYKGRVRLKSQKSSSKKLLLIVAVVVAILAVSAVPVLASTNEDSTVSDAVARLLGVEDAEALAALLALEDEADESCGPACSYYADNFAEAIGHGSARACRDLDLEGGDMRLPNSFLTLPT